MDTNADVIRSLQQRFPLMTSQNYIYIYIYMRKLTFEYDQMRVTSKMPKNYKQKQ